MVDKAQVTGIILVAVGEAILEKRRNLKKHPAFLSEISDLPRQLLNLEALKVKGWTFRNRRLLLPRWKFG
jgi:hypothetical protein